MSLNLIIINRYTTLILFEFLLNINLYLTIIFLLLNYYNNKFNKFIILRLIIIIFI